MSCKKCHQHEGVPLAHVREIKQDLDLFYIWNTLPHDVMLVMHHVVSSLVLIWSL